jgi:PAS domain S-box-containing protein
MITKVILFSLIVMDTNLFYQSAEFQYFFNSARRSLVLSADAPKFTILAASDLYLHLTHKKRHEVIGRGLFEVYPGNHSDPAEKDSVFSSFMRVIETGLTDELPIFKYEIDIEGSSLKETHYWTNVNEPLLGPDGKVAQIINTTTNITEQIRQEHAVKESENRFRLMAEGTDVMIAVGDETGAAVYFNKAWSEATGRTNEKLLNDGWFDLMHPDDINSVTSILTKAFIEKKAWELEFRMPHKEGGYRWFLARGIPRFSNDNLFAGYIISTIDINDQKKQRAQLQTLIEELQSTNEQLAAISREREFVNEELLRTQKDLIEANIQLTGSENSLMIANHRLSVSEQTLQTAIQSANLGIWYINAETRVITSSSRVKELFGFLTHEEMTLDAAINQVIEEYRDDVVEAINAAIERNDAYDIECPIIGFHDGNLRWVRATGKLYSAENNEPPIFSGTIADITERKKNEQRKNDFISMVSHELKTPLTTMQGYIQILQGKAGTSNDSLASTMLEKAKKQTHRMATLINGFLNVSRLESGQIHIDRKMFDIANLIREVEEEFKASVKSHTILFAPVVTAFVNADFDKIGQVINNLISNAVKYSPYGSTIDVMCKTIIDKVLVCVHDRGAGISQENLPKLFERFFRIENKEYENVSGFGIGLYLCSEIISRHNGKIWVESELGVGSKFYFTLNVEAIN